MPAPQFGDESSSVRGSELALLLCFALINVRCFRVPHDEGRCIRRPLERHFGQKTGSENLTLRTERSHVPIRKPFTPALRIPPTGRIAQAV
jgi:hypothetical protein